MKYVTVLVPVNESQVLSMMAAHSIDAKRAVEKITKQNMKSGLGTINAAALNEISLAITQNKLLPLQTEEVNKINLQKFIDTYLPVSCSRYKLDEEITREDRILAYYTISTKREAAKLLDQHLLAPPIKLTYYLWIIIAENVDNDVVITLRPYIEGAATLAKYQDLQGYVATEKPHNGKNIVVTLSNQ